MDKTYFLVLGTRPEIIKASLVIKLAERHGLNLTLIHTGQHYSYGLDKIFFEELGVRDPDAFLEVGSMDSPEQVSAVIKGVHSLVKEHKPDMLLVQGDTNTTSGVALVAGHDRIPLGHIEAGLRSGDFFMREEVNRIIADSIASHCYAPTEWNVKNLLSENKNPRSVFQTGNTIVDVTLQNRKRFRSSEKIDYKDYVLLTLHRSENVDFKKTLANIASNINTLDNEIIFPVHPRTRKRLDEFGIKFNENMHLIEPVGYLEFMSLLEKSSFIITDSGGILEECATLKKAAMVLRQNTERPEGLGTFYVLSHPDSSQTEFKRDVEKVISLKKTVKKHENPFGDGHASERIIDLIKDIPKISRSCFKTQDEYRRLR